MQPSHAFIEANTVTDKAPKIRLPRITKQPGAITIKSGRRAVLKVEAKGTGPFRYQWYQGKVGQKKIQLGRNSAIFKTPALSLTTSYWVQVSSAVGSTNSKAAVVTVITKPKITTQPVSTTINSGSTANLSVSASGTAPLSYQWYEGSVGTTTIPVGINSTSFTTPALTTTASYWVRVSNAAGSVDSTASVVTVNVARPPDPEEFALIPAGNFQIGDSFSYVEQPRYTIYVSAYYIGRYEVSKALWFSVQLWGSANGYDVFYGNGKAENHPVSWMSWYDAVKWCNARSEKEGLTPVYTVKSGAVMRMGRAEPVANWNANGYRLPTAAEWEKAARGGVNGKRFPWGTDTISHEQANYTTNSLLTYDLSAPPGGGISHPIYGTGMPPWTAPVGSFTANGYGLHDMAGNVSELCWDGVGGPEYVDGAIDPRRSGEIRAAYHRGGSYTNDAEFLHCAHRISWVRPEHRYDSVGFRIVRGKP